jgi:hypothetical protein
METGFIEGPVKKFSIKDETTRLPNGSLACKHCPKQFKVVAQAFRHFKETHSKLTYKRTPAKPVEVQEKPETSEHHRQPQNHEEGHEGHEGMGYGEMFNEELLRPEVNLVLDDDSDKEESAAVAGKSEAPKRRTRMYPCNHCNEEFPSTALVRNHVEKAHRDMFKFACQSCDARFAKSNELLQHRNQKHESTKDKYAHLYFIEGDRLLCKACLKCFRQLVKMHIHLKKEHSKLVDVKPCQICKIPMASCKHGKKWDAMTNWICPRCRRPFTSQQQLNIHILNCSHKPFHHMSHYKCQFCTDIFINEQELLVHRREVHPTTFYQCQKCDQVSVL